VFSEDIYLMKLLSVPLFTVLTVVVYADQSVFPPVYSEVGVADLQPLKPFASPTLSPRTQPPLAPRLPLQVEEEIPHIVRAQSSSVGELADILGSPPPLAKGAVEEGTIDSKLLGTSDLDDMDSPIVEGSFVQNPKPASLAGQGTQSADPLGYMVLLMVTAVTTLGLVYMAFVAYDYRQRWMQSLMVQNDRYLGGGAFDVEKPDDFYGSYGGSPVLPAFIIFLLSSCLF